MESQREPGQVGGNDDRPLTPRDRWRRGMNSPGKSGLSLMIEDAWHSARGQAACLNAAEHLWEYVFNDRERQLLGNDRTAAINKYRTLGMWQHVRGGTARQAVVAIGIMVCGLDPAKGEALLRLVGEKPLHDASPNATAAARSALEIDESSKKQAIQCCELVIDTCKREVFWAGNLLPIKWFKERMPWNLFVELARKAKAGRSLDDVAFLPNQDAKPGYLKNLKGRLVNLKGFPTELNARILDEGQGTYRLKVERKQIRIFDEQTKERLVEIQR